MSIEKAPLPPATQEPSWDELDIEESAIEESAIGAGAASNNNYFSEKKIEETTVGSDGSNERSDSREEEELSQTAKTSPPSPPAGFKSWLTQLHPAPGAPIGPPPNGGLEAWLVVAAGFFALFNSWGVVNAFGSFEAYYSNNLLKQETQSAISWIGAIQGFIIVSTGIFSGRLTDAGYGRYMIWIGTFMVSFGYMMSSLATEFYQVLLAQGFCIGIGANLLFW